MIRSRINTFKLLADVPKGQLTIGTVFLLFKSVNGCSIKGWSIR